MVALLCVFVFAGALLSHSNTANADTTDGVFAFSQNSAISASANDCSVSLTTVDLVNTGLNLSGMDTTNVHKDNYLRFTGVTLPDDAVVTKAYISFTVRDISSQPTNITITGQTGSGDPFVGSVASFASRAFTNASATMTTPVAMTVGTTLNTPDLSPLLNEMHASNSSMSDFVFKIVGNDVGSFVVRTFDYGAAFAPTLYIEYTSASGTSTVTPSTIYDSAEQYGTANVMTFGGLMELGGYFDNSLSPAARDILGFRFPNVVLPANAEIVDAYLQFTAATTGPATNVANITVKAELGNAQPYSTTAYNVTNRQYGTQSVQYSQPALQIGQVVRTPNLANIINEDRLMGWQSGQAMAFMVDGNSFLGAVYPGPTSNPPKLVIQYKYNSAGLTIPGASNDPASLQNVYLNEVSNGTGTCANPWVELYNANNTPVILDNGVYLGDDSAQNKYEFSNFMIPANGYRTLNLNSAGGTASANFTLDNSDYYGANSGGGTGGSGLAPLLINQVFCGGSADGAVDRNFVELYNPNDTDIVLDGYSLQYYQNAVSQAAGWDTLALTGTIPAHGSFLVVGTGAQLTGARYSVTNWDQDWPGMTFDNHSGSIALVQGTTPLPAVLSDADWANIQDVVGVQNAAGDPVPTYYSGTSYVAGISKQKAARRIDFSATGNNNADFVVLDYRSTGMTDDQVAANRPRWSGDGNWGLGLDAKAGGGTGSGSSTGSGLAPLLINQVFSGGSADGAVDRNFIELYNPTDNDMVLDGYSLQYYQNAVSQAAGWTTLSLTGTIPAHGSFLVVGTGAQLTGARYSVNYWDQDWPGMTFDNHSGSFALVQGTTPLPAVLTDADRANILDLVGVQNSGSDPVPTYYSGTSYVSGISKQKSARRIDFYNTGNNNADFAVLDYRSTGMTDDQVAANRPRWSGDGHWGVGLDANAMPSTPTTPTTPSEDQPIVARTLSLSASDNGTLKTIDQLSYLSMQTGETYGRFTDGDSHIVKFANDGTYGKSNNPLAPVMSYSVDTPSGQYADPIDVTVTTDSVNTVVYTLDGSIPSKTYGNVYSGPIHISQSATLRLFIFNSKQDSGVLAYAYDIGQSGLTFAQNTVSYPIATSADDAYSNGTTVTLADGALYLNGQIGTTGVTNYLRFTGIDLPSDAVITNAYITFTALSATSSSTNITVSGELGACSPYTANITSLSGRSYTSDSVTTATPATAAVGAKFNTGDITALLNEMRSNNGGISDYAFMVSGDGTGAFTAQSFDYIRTNAPTLVIQYYSGYGKYVASSGNIYDSAKEYGTGHAVAIGGNQEIGGYMVANVLTPPYKQVSDYRFAGVTIPAGAEITNAYIQFTVAVAAPVASNGITANINITAENGNPAAYAAPAYNLSDRSFGLCSTLWQQPAFTQALTTVQTPNIKDLIDEQRLNGWQSGQALAFNFDGDNYIGSVYGSGTLYAPQLVIEYKYSNNGPSISAAQTDPSIPRQTTVDNGKLSDSAQQYGVSQVVDLGGNLGIGGYFAAALTGSYKDVTALRFSNVTIPAGATVTNAYIEFTVSAVGSTLPAYASSNMVIRAENGNPATYTTTASSVSSRSYGQYAVNWQQPAFTSLYQVVQTPNLSDLINEQRLNGWQSGQALAFMIDGDNYIGTVFRTGSAYTPKLVVQYQYGGQGASISAAMTDPTRVFQAPTAYNLTTDTAEENGTAHTISRDSMEIGGYFSTIETDVYKCLSGFRFPNVQIPAGAEITSAYLQFTVITPAPVANANAQANMTIKAESGDAGTYSALAYNISNRQYGQLSVNYQQPAFTSALQVVQTPDLKNLIDEQRLNGWQSGQALSFMITGDKYIGAIYRSSTEYSPKLVIQYKLNGNGPSIDGAVTGATQISNIFVNEVSAQGTSSSKDSWVELYNANDYPVILGKGTYLSTKATSLTTFEFNNMLVPAHGYSIVTCDGIPTLGPSHAGFTLSSTGTVYLSANDATGKPVVVDSLTYGAQQYNLTTGRYPDGSSNVVLFQSETYGTSNNNGQQSYQVSVDHDRGVYASGFTLAITSSNPNATIKYSVDGTTTPSAAAGLTYTGPISISESCVVKIYAYDAYGNSGLQAYTYILENNLQNEVTLGVLWQFKSNITDADYAAAMSSLPIISVTSDSGTDLVPNADYTQSTFEYIDAQLGQGNHNYFSYCGSKKFGQMTMTWYNSGVDIKFHRDYDATKAKVDFFGPMPGDAYPTPIKYTKLQLKEGEDGPQSDIWNLGYLRYDDAVTHTLGIQMGKFDLRTQYVQYFYNGKYMGVKTLRENFSDGSFENYFGGDSTDYTTLDFQDTAWSTGVTTSGDPTLLPAIQATATAKNFQEFKKYVDINDFIKFQILFMFTDTENEAEAILHNDAYDGGGVKMITNINDIDGAFFNNGMTGTGAYALAGDGGTYRYKWLLASSRNGIGGWFGAFSGDSTTDPTAGNLEFKTLVKDQVLQQIGPYSGNLTGAPGAPLSVANVQNLILKNYEQLDNNSVYKVDAAFMGARVSIYQDWVNIQPNIQLQTYDRVSYTLQMWAAYGMVHTLSPVTFTDNGSGIVLNNPNSGTDVYYTTNGSDPMGPDGVVSSAATKYTAGTVLPYTGKITVRAFTTNNWGPITSK
ncbi:MAG: chitobiase/beta-hexosaminidase C-terminal domain-containing protein [Coriobacteriia bacterium]|nr:chitobiase/beta-hexosaminidase C-terminal domain-containing protein [Coriobacteriia bacterium]